MFERIVSDCILMYEAAVQETLSCFNVVFLEDWLAVEVWD